mmetsp:Transcript_30765/g.70965  ORF Transcript_30765/g.70965 Transcript_30765/m.70965 type:complete len:255 (-) Transcript_30765:815-1579(-)
MASVLVQVVRLAGQHSDAEHQDLQEAVDGTRMHKEPLQPAHDEAPSFDGCQSAAVGRKRHSVVGVTQVAASEAACVDSVRHPLAETVLVNMCQTAAALARRDKRRRGGVANAAAVSLVVVVIVGPFRRDLPNTSQLYFCCCCYCEAADKSTGAGNNSASPVSELCELCLSSFPHMEYHDVEATQADKDHYKPGGREGRLDVPGEAENQFFITRLVLRLQLRERNGQLVYACWYVTEGHTVLIVPLLRAQRSCKT